MDEVVLSEEEIKELKNQILNGVKNAKAQNIKERKQKIYNDNANLINDYLKKQREQEIVRRNRKKKSRTGGNKNIQNNYNRTVKNDQSDNSLKNNFIKKEEEKREEINNRIKKSFPEPEKTDENKLPEVEGGKGVFELPQDMEIEKQPEEKNAGQEDELILEINGKVVDIENLEERVSAVPGMEEVEQNEENDRQGDIADHVINEVGAAKNEPNNEVEEEAKNERNNEIEEEAKNERNNEPNNEIEEEAKNERNNEPKEEAKNERNNEPNNEVEDAAKNEPEIEYDDFLSGLYFVLTGKEKRYTAVERNELMDKDVDKRLLYHRTMQKKLELDAVNQIKKERNKNEFKDKIKNFEENMRDTDGMRRIDGFLKMDYTIFDNFEDIYIVLNFEKLNNAIEQSEHIYKDVLPLAVEAGTIDENTRVNVTALAMAIDDYKEYMNYRIMIIADENYTLALDEEPFRMNADDAAIYERLDKFTSDNNLSERNLNTLMHFVTYKTGMNGNDKGDRKRNPLFAEHFNDEKSNMLTRMQQYGFSAEEKEENVDEDIDEDLAALEQQVKAEDVDQEADREAANIPEVPEILIPKRRRQLNYLITGNDIMPQELHEGEEKNRSDLAGKAREIYQAWENMNPELSLERALLDVSKYEEQGFILPPEILEVVRAGIRPGESLEVRKANADTLAEGMYRGDNEDAKQLPHILISNYMRTDFSIFDALDDEAIVSHYNEAKRLLNYGLSLQELFYQTADNKTCLLSQDRADNFYAILSALRDYMDYATIRMDIIRSPFYSLFDVDKEIKEQDIKQVEDAGKGEYEADLLMYIKKYADIAPYIEKVKRGGFYERASGYGYVDINEYLDENPEMQEKFREYITQEKNMEMFAVLPQLVEYYGEEDETAIENIARSNELRIERNNFNNVQKVVGSNKDYDEVKNDPKYEEQTAGREALSERAVELINSLNVEETDANIWLDELMDTDVSILDNMSSDEKLIEHFEDILKLTTRWKIIKEKLSVYDEQGMHIPSEDRIKLKGLQEMLSDAQVYLILKLNQIKNPFYKNMHLSDEIGNENTDVEAFNRRLEKFENDNAELMNYVQATGLVVNSAFLSMFAGNGKNTAEKYIQAVSTSEEARIQETNQNRISKMADNYAAVTYLFDGGEGQINADMRLFSEGSGKREGRTKKSLEAVDAYTAYNEKVMDTFKTAKERLKVIRYANYDIDPKIINGIYTMLKIGGTEEDIKYNTELLMNLGAENINTRGAAYKEMVDNLLAVELSKFDRCDDEYFIANYTELKSLAEPAIALARPGVINSFAKNGYRISEQKKKNLVALSDNIKKYMDFMDARMKVIQHPLYELVFRETDNNKDFKPEELKQRMLRAGQMMSSKDRDYIEVLVNAFSVSFPFAMRNMSMRERLEADGYKTPEGGAYDEDIAGNEAYQQEIADDHIIKETVELRTEQFVTNVLKELGTGDGKQSLEDYEKQNADREKRKTLSEKMRTLPEFDSVEPVILVMDLLAGHEDVINAFLSMDFKELDNLSDETIVERYQDIAALCRVDDQVRPALETLRADYNDTNKDAKDKPTTTTISAVVGRLEMLNDLRNYMVVKRLVISNPLYEKHYNEAYLSYHEDAGAMHDKIDSLEGKLSEDEAEYLRNVASIMSKPFMARYTGNGKTTADAYGKQQENDNFARGELKDEGKKNVILDENERSAGEISGDPEDINTSLANIEGELGSKAMSEPLNELKTFTETSQYQQRLYKREMQTRNFSKDINHNMQPIKEQIKIIFNLLNEEMNYGHDDQFAEELDLLLNHFEVLGVLCSQYLTGTRNKTSDDMNQAAIRKVRRIRDIAHYAYTQTYTSARMSRIYFRQQDISGRRVPWINMYHYAEQPIVWEQGLVPYTEINKEEISAIKGEKKPRTRLKEFTPEDNSFVKIEHWMTIFSECKPDYVNAIDRELSIKDMEKIEKLVNTVNMRTNQGLPDDSRDFIRACDDMIHSFTATNIRLKKYIDNMKVETEDDKTQKRMLENVMYLLKSQIDLYNVYGNSVPDTYEVIKNDPKNDTISDVFLSWYQDYAARAIKKMEQMKQVEAGTGEKDS